MLLLAGLALAEFPLPVYPECGEPDRPELCPTELEGRWNFLSYVPAAWGVSLATDEEEGMGAGMWVDRAFRITTGRTDVRIAVLDSGAEWDEENLLYKWALNEGELPQRDGGCDQNGDGACTIADWLDAGIDPAAGDDRSDGFLDPSDLIATFSDGVDNDGNGYTDDICGWDFLWNDNNPYDDVRYGHGNGIAEDAAAEGNDGGAIGTCPNCTVVPVRVGDSFVVDGSAFGSGLGYAVDLGVPVAAVAVGAVSQPAWVGAMVDHAWNSGTLVIGSAADETAWHPNAPGMAAHTFYVHAITHDADEPEEATSFLAYSNCTNHGVRLDGSASSDSCSSGATGVTAGIAGLVVSAAWDAGWTPSPAEVHSILLRSADDIALPDDPTRWPSAPGWDSWSGWGRINAERAVVDAQRGPPPTAEIVSPAWYEWVNPAATPEVVVSGTIGSRGGEIAAWNLSYGTGIAPSSWTTIASGAGAIDGEIARFILPVFDTTVEDPPRGATPVDREVNANAATVQLRLAVTDETGATVVARSAFYAKDDPDLLDGWPLHLGASLESSPALADIDGDGVIEVIQADGDGWIHALHADGSELPGWPVHTELLAELDPEGASSHAGSASAAAVGAERYAPVVASPAIGDLDGDGTLEVVVATFRGRLHVFQTDGTERPGFPVRSSPIQGTDEDDSLADCFFSSPALADLAGAGTKWIVIGGGDGFLHAWGPDGTEADGFPVRLAWPGEPLAERRIVASPAIGDLGGDARDDIVIGTNETLDEEHAVLYAVSGDGTFLPGWPRRIWGLYVDVLPMVGQGVPNSAALVDLVGDSTPEIVTHGLAGDVTVYDATGEELMIFDSALSAYGPGSNVSDTTIFPVINSPSVGDLDGDGLPDVVNGGSGFDYARASEQDGVRFDFDHALGGWSGLDGTFLPGFPRQMEDLQFFMNPAVVDIDGDHQMEAIAGSGGFLLHAWNADGVEPPGWPKLTGQWILASPAVGDLDGDGTLEVVVGTRSGDLFAWHTDSPAGADAGWVTFGHDNARTRNYATALPGFNLSDDEFEAPYDCGCDSAPTPWGMLPGLAAAGVVWTVILIPRRRTSPTAA